MIKIESRGRLDRVGVLCHICDHFLCKISSCIRYYVLSPPAGIMFSCARLVAEAIQKHNYQMGDELEKPLTTQCILTDGIRLTFISYQLNTLSFSDDEGMKNMAWISPGVFMYKRIVFDDIEKREKSAKERKRFRRVKKDPTKHEIVLEEFNDDCFETFFKMIVNGCQAI